MKVAADMWADDPIYVIKIHQVCVSFRLSFAISILSQLLYIYVTMPITLVLGHFVVKNLIKLFEKVAKKKAANFVEIFYKTYVIQKPCCSPRDTRGPRDICDFCPRLLSVTWGWKRVTLKHRWYMSLFPWKYWVLCFQFITGRDFSVGDCA